MQASTEQNTSTKMTIEQFIAAVGERRIMSVLGAKLQDKSYAQSFTTLMGIPPIHIALFLANGCNRQKLTDIVETEIEIAFEDPQAMFHMNSAAELALVNVGKWIAGESETVEMPENHEPKITRHHLNVFVDTVSKK